MRFLTFPRISRSTVITSISELRISRRVLHALDGCQILQKTHPIGQLQGEISRDRVGHEAGIGGVFNGGQDLGGDTLAEFQVFFEPFDDPPGKRLVREAGSGGLVQIDHFPFQELAVVLNVLDPDPSQALYKHLDRAFREIDRLDNLGPRPDGEQVAGPGIFDFGVSLGREGDMLPRLHGLLDGVQGFLPADEQRHHDVGKDDDVPKGEDGQDLPGGRTFLREFLGRGLGRLHGSEGTGRQLARFFSYTRMGGSLNEMTSSVTTHSFTSTREGISYMVSSIISSRMDRSPRAPVFRFRASFAIATSDSSVKRRADVLEFEQPLILLDQGVLGLAKDLDQRLFIQFVQVGDDR